MNMYLSKINGKNVLFLGSLLWAGEYFECINVTQPDWNGKYCFLGSSNTLPNVYYVNSIFSAISRNKIQYFSYILIKIT